MDMVVGVRFKRAGKIFDFDGTGLQVAPGNRVMVDTSRGIELGEVVRCSPDGTPRPDGAPLKKVLRLANEEDLGRNRTTGDRSERALSICREKIARHDLEMRPVEAEYNHDGSRVTISFTAEGRVDFRELVRDLASALRARVELRQVGARDEAKVLGGIGPCGRELCCASFLTDFKPVSIKMAKDQNISLNPTKISGVCGRLMCCLRYEMEGADGDGEKAPRKKSCCNTGCGNACVKGKKVQQQA